MKPTLRQQTRLMGIGNDIMTFRFQQAKELKQFSDLEISDVIYYLFNCPTKDEATKIIKIWTEEGLEKMIYFVLILAKEKEIKSISDFHKGQMETILDLIK